MRAWAGRRAGFPPRACPLAGPVGPISGHARPFLRTPRPHLRRGPCPCAGPLRRGAPAAASRGRSGGFRPRPLWGLAGPAPRASPPALPLGLVRRFAAPAALAGPVCPGLPLASRRAPSRGVALASSRGRPWSARGPAGSPPARPLRGFGGGWLLPRGRARPMGRAFLRPAPGAFFLARARAGSERRPPLFPRPLFSTAVPGR